MTLRGSIPPMLPSKSAIPPVPSLYKGRHPELKHTPEPLNINDYYCDMDTTSLDFDETQRRNVQKSMLPSTKRPISRMITQIGKEYSEWTLPHLMDHKRTPRTSGRGCMSTFKRIKDAYVESRDYLDLFLAVLKFVLFIILVICFFKLYDYVMDLKGNLVDVMQGVGLAETELAKITDSLRALTGGLANVAGTVGSTAQKALGSL